MLSRRGEPLGRGIARQPQHLGSHAVEEPGMAILVAALQEEDPHHHRVDVLGAIGERREVFGDRVLGHPEAGEQRRQEPAALGREPGPGFGVGGEIDRCRVPLELGHDLGVGREPREDRQLRAVSRGER